MEQWEYDVEILRADANAEEARGYLERHWPGQNLPKYTVQTLVPSLNRRGSEGWELVSLEPIFVGDKGDVKLPVGDQGSFWTNAYLAVWKRREKI